MMMLIAYILLFLLLTVYSYTQIDLNLTLSSNATYQAIQNQLIQIGYFNRPLSTILFLFILLLFVICYLFTLRKASQNKLSLKNLSVIIAISIGVLLFSYSAFSYDLFNYMFDARIVTTYHLNPYSYKALDFPGDLWTRFMHWTHRTYPYGPAWLFISIPFSFLGFGKFVPTLLLFKTLFILAHVLNIFLIYKILQKLSPKKALFGVTFYALNPLIIIESIVSPHLDSVMLTFLLLGFYFLYVSKKNILSGAALIVSGLIKFVTFPLLVPFFLFMTKVDKLDKKKNLFLFINFVILLFTLFIPILQREPYPWYFIPLIGVGSLLIDFGWLSTLLIGLSVGLLLRYAPFLYIGDYPAYLPSVQFILLIVPTLFAGVFVLLKKFVFPLFSQNKK